MRSNRRRIGIGLDMAPVSVSGQVYGVNLARHRGLYMRIYTRKPPCGEVAQSCSNVSIICIAAGGGGHLDWSSMFP